MPVKTKAKAEFGDFQTPPDLADAVCRKVLGLIGAPTTILEPTCGVGNLLRAAREQLGADVDLIGVDINPAHLDSARAALEAVDGAGALRLLHEDFFHLDWDALLAEVRAPLLVLGNPPWVTNSEVGLLDGSNLPPKNNDLNLHRLEALTGRSNFDISEWMGWRLLQSLKGRDATIALLLKSSVARKILAQAWPAGLPIREAAMFRIDAREHFGVAVDACLFVVRTDRPGERRCPVFADLTASRPEGILGVDEDGELVADVDGRARTRGLLGEGRDEWRSGVKHDCARVLELRGVGSRLLNGFGDAVDVEPEVLYPLMKGSDVAGGRLGGRRWLIVPQTKAGQDTSHLQRSAPRTWAYLSAHAEALDGRKSSIYRKQARFSIFGVGAYTFAPWKVAISGLHKAVRFTAVGPVEGKPVVFDDTVYLTPCASEHEARLKARLLNSPMAGEFFSSIVFWDAKRPITAKVLRRLDMTRLAEALGEGAAAQA